ncbi:MAG: heme lyase CcmF/NrfE family subunit [Dehalococcoidia bacterium]|nr:heme lyase CcmF/NrfE family subunit [Dehalococcoidia bacterium]
MPDAGYIAIAIALAASVYSIFAYILGTKQKQDNLLLSARNSVIAVCGLLSAAVSILLLALVTRDFRLEYVASYTDASLSLFYTLSAVWAGGSGSLLFWAWVLSIFAVVLVVQKRDIGKELVPVAAAVTMATQIFFLILLLSISNPFKTLPYVPPDGNGLNPLLQNPGMFLHPPTQLIGYIGFTIPFALAMAALITGKLGDEWVIMSRRWTIIAWLMLTIGNLAGAWWAYYVLGWGGYWAWDPVENAGLLPFLVGTAFMHSIMMQRRRGILKRWNIVLVILSFVLSIFGTFLTRSGVLASVHSFAESALGPFFIVFMGLILFVSFGLLRYRNQELKSESEIESMVSRESTFLFNNLLLVGSAFAVFLGTVFPLISEAVRGVKITVGPPFYNQVMAPIFLAIIVLTGLCTLIGWRRASAKNLVHNFLWPFIFSFAFAIVLFIIGVRQWLALIGLWASIFVLATILSEWVRGTLSRNKAKKENVLKAFNNLLLANRPRYGGYIVHIGIVIFAFGVIGSTAFGASKEAALVKGESITVKNYTLTFQAFDQIETVEKVQFMATLDVRKDNVLIGQILPLKYYHRKHDSPATVPAVRNTFTDDLYVILIGWDETGSVSFKVMSNPLVNWIWFGGVILTLGALFAWWPEKSRVPVSIPVARRVPAGAQVVGRE